MTILTKDSPFYRIPASLPRETALVLDGIRHSLEMLGMTYQRLVQQLVFVTEAHVAGKGVSVMASSDVFLSVWSSVDVMYRIRGLLTRPPFDSSQSATAQLLDQFGQVRAINAHLPGNLNKILAESGAVLGKLTFLAVLGKPERLFSCLMIPGSAGPQTKGDVYHPHDGEALAAPVGRIELRIAGKTANLTEGYDAVLRFMEDCEPKLTQEFDRMAAAGASMDSSTDMFGFCEVGPIAVHNP